MESRYKNGIISSPIFDEIRQYFQNNKTSRIFIFVPFIKAEILKKLIDSIDSKIIIVTTWNPQNILDGSSELELYPFCKENNITLYINNNIHLKVFSLNLESAIISSSNISQKGLMQSKNYEAGVLVKKLSSRDRLYFEKIRNESILVNDEIYQQFQDWYSKQQKIVSKTKSLEEIISILPKDQFLTSALPMTKDIDELVEGYMKIISGLEPSNDMETTECIYHDLVNYNIEQGLTKQEFLEKLKIQFFAHPFIQKIDEFINPEAYFGTIKEWIQNNCTDVPVPSRRELTGNVQVLYEWFEKLGDGKYIIDVPGTRSQRIRKVSERTYLVSKLENQVLRILATPGFTIDEIQKNYENLGKSMHHNNAEKENIFNPVWHYKIEMDEKMRKAMPDNINLDEKYPNGKSKFYHAIAHVIEKLNKQELIVVWYNSGITGDGIWRLSKKGQEEVVLRGLVKP